MSAADVFDPTSGAGAVLLFTSRLGCPEMRAGYGARAPPEGVAP